MIHLQTARRWIATGLLCIALTGCAGAVIGTVADVAIEAVKIPFKVAGAVVETVVPDGDD